eukprot:g329.t1
MNLYPTHNHHYNDSEASDPYPPLQDGKNFNTPSVGLQNDQQQLALQQPVVQVTPSYQEQYNVSPHQQQPQVQQISAVPFAAPPVVKLRTKEDRDIKKSSSQEELVLRGSKEKLDLTTSVKIQYGELSFDTMIGNGAFGCVYKGEFRQTTVAIKVLTLFTSSSTTEFYEEIAMLAMLRHPNIVQFMGFTIAPPPHKSLCIVTEYMEKGSLWDILHQAQQPHQLGWLTGLGFLQDTARAMSFLHGGDQKILHRDLKSPNLLVTKSFNVKVSDFGLARVFQTERRQTMNKVKMTRGKGTLHWMAPEVLTENSYSEKADVYSFAIILWEVAMACFDGRPCVPYDEHNLTDFQLGIQVVRNNLRPTVSNSWPKDFVHLMTLCWASDPDVRPFFPSIMERISAMTR